MHEDVEKVLVAEEVIEKRLDVIAGRITADFREEETLQAVAILKGALVFMADLLRRVPLKLDLECLNVASYHGGTESSGQVDFLDQQLPDVKGRTILLIDDILDTGRTLQAVSEKLIEMGAKDVKTCVLLTKDKERAAQVEADYSAFEIGDEFVVGYGLDYDGKYRNLPYVGILNPSAIQS
ncbi:MAG: hypoxanthine phosphoribosyltransferase [Akkermansiaceae bacterium]